MKHTMIGCGCHLLVNDCPSLALYLVCTLTFYSNIGLTIVTVGVFIRDLTFFNDGNQKTLRNGLLNFSKLRTMVLKVRAEL